MAQVLVAFEFTGTVRDAFTARGHYAISCDFLPSETPGPHFQGDVREILDTGFDLMIAHPPCTHLASSGARHFSEKLHLQEEALELVRLILEAPIPRIAVENPVGIISNRIRKPDQIIQPYEFGEDASKKTCLWLKDLPPLQPTKIVEPRWIWGLPRWGNQTNGGQLKAQRTDSRARDRTRTYPGIADAMACQWGFGG